MEILSKLFKDIQDGTINNDQLKGFVIGSLIPMAQNSRQRFDIRWYLNDAYYKGDQWVGFNKFSGQIEQVRLEPWRDKIIINFCQISLDAMTSLLTNKRPSFFVAPVEDDSKKVVVTDLLGQPIIDPATGKQLTEVKKGPMVIEAEHATSALESISYNTNFRKKYLDVVHDALKFGNGFLKIFYDTALQDGLGEVNQARKSPFAMYIDPLCTDNVTMRDARFIIEVTQRDVTQVKLEYNVDSLTPDNKYSESEYEQMSKNVRYGSNMTGNADTVLVYECWLKVPTKGVLNAVDFQMVCLTMTKDKVLRVVLDPTGYNDHPYVSYTYRPIPGEFYGQGLITAIRDLNDQINRRMSQMSENATLMGNPRFWAKRGTIRQGEVTNQPGTISQHDSDQAPTQMAGVNVTTDVQNIVNLLANWTQDLAQTHDVSIGRVPPNVTSGLQVELLQAADSNILSPHFEAFEEFLKEVAKKMLYTMKAKYPAGRKFTVRDKRGNVESFDFDPSTFNFSDIRVEIDSALAHTKAGRQNILMELLGRGVLDTQTFLEYFGGFDKDIANIVERRQEEMSLGINTPQPQAGKQEMNPIPQPGLPAGQSLYGQQ